MPEQEEDTDETIREKLRKCLQASMIAFGSDGVGLQQFIINFKEDWSIDLYKSAKQLGFKQVPDGVLAMLKTFPGDIIVQEHPQVKLKPVPNDQTRGNLKLIDTSNKEIAKEKAAAKARIAARQPYQNPNLMPLRQISFQAPLKPAAKVKSIPLPPPPRQSVKNANLEPLGPRRSFHSSFHQPNGRPQPPPPQKSSRSQSREFGKSLPQATRPASAKPPLNFNDFGGVLQRQCVNLCTTGQQRQSRSRPTTPANEDKPADLYQYEAAYQDEDFHAPPSCNISAASSLSSSRQNIMKEVNDVPKQVQNERSLEEGEIQEDDYASDEFDSDYDWDIDINFDDHDEEEQQEEDINAECTHFLNTTSLISSQHLYRFVHLFRKNNGTWTQSNFDNLKKLYCATFTNALTSKELNRLLGSPEMIKTVRDSFKKCSWPSSSLFKVIDRTTSIYNIELLQNMAEASIDLSNFISTSVSVQMQKPTQIHLATSSPAPSVSSVKIAQTSKKAMATPSNASAISPKPGSNDILSTSTPPHSTNDSTEWNSEEFAELAIYAYHLLSIAKNGRKSLTELFDKIRKTYPGQFQPILMADKTIFLGYLREYFHKSFICEFTKEGVMLSVTDVAPRLEVLPDLMEMLDQIHGGNIDFYRGDRHQVILLKFLKDDNDLVLLKLATLEAKLSELLEEYGKIMEVTNDDMPVFEPVTGQLVFFFVIDNQRHLCRGQFQRQDGKERAVVRDIDSGKDRYVLSKDIYEIPVNFPQWRFPPCLLTAKIIDGNEAKLKQFWQEKHEFTIDIDSNNGTFCRVMLIE